MATDGDRSDVSDDAFLEQLVALAGEAQDIVAAERMSNGAAVPWEDLAPIAGAVFGTWTAAGSMVWAEHAWTALTAAGLTKARTEVDRARVVCRLLALTVLHQEFCARAFEEGIAGDWSLDWTDVLGEESPCIDPFVLGQLAERDGIDVDVEVGWGFEEGTPATAFKHIVRDQYAAVAAALRDHWGKATMFANLWSSTDADVAYPLARDLVSEAVNGNVSAAKLDAWQWIDEGPGLG